MWLCPWTALLTNQLAIDARPRSPLTRPAVVPPALSGGGVRESHGSARKAVHNLPPSSRANRRWQNHSRLSRRTEEGYDRGAERGGASETATGVTTRRREGHLPASSFSPQPLRDFGPLCPSRPESRTSPGADPRLRPICGPPPHALVVSPAPPTRVTTRRPRPRQRSRTPIGRPWQTPRGPGHHPRSAAPVAGACQPLVTLGLAADQAARRGRRPKVRFPRTNLFWQLLSVKTALRPETPPASPRKLFRVSYCPYNAYGDSFRGKHKRTAGPVRAGGAGFLT